MYTCIRLEVSLEYLCEVVFRQNESLRVYAKVYKYAITLSLPPRLLILPSSSHSLLPQRGECQGPLWPRYKDRTHFTTFLFISSLAPGAECHFRDTQTA